MPYVIQITPYSYVGGPRNVLTYYLSKARIFKRKCDATNSLRHGKGGKLISPCYKPKVVEVSLRVKKPRVKKQAPVTVDPFHLTPPTDNDSGGFRY